MHITRSKKAATLLLGFILMLMLAPKTSSALEEVGFFYNDELQDLVQRDIEFVYDDEKFPVTLESFAQTKSVLITKPGYHSEIENFEICPEKINGIEVCDLARPVTAIVHPKKGAVLYVNTTKIDEHLGTIAEQISAAPVNGRLEMTDDGQLKVLQHSTLGLELDIQSSSATFLDQMKTLFPSPTVQLAVKTTDPDISTDHIGELGIKELIGHGESNFRGSPRNRIHNINVATKKFDGHLLKPGEEFSFTTILGPVEGYTGYKEELVIKNNETIPEFGGGVCQVSTTMFRVALNSGLRITERHNHAYPVQYYAPQGTDATIYLPKPDLRFVNDTPGHVLIQAKIAGTILSFDFYGTSDGRQVEIDGPKVTQRTADGKMRTVLYQIVKDTAGAVLRKDTFNSFYDNPANYHKPEFTSKPDDWSNKQWDEYRAQHGI